MQMDLFCTSFDVTSCVRTMRMVNGASGNPYWECMLSIPSPPLQGITFALPVSEASQEEYH